MAVAASVALVCYAGRDTWFRIDAWEFLMRNQDGSLDSWFRPHGAHLQLPAVALHRFLYATFGMDFWPGYYLPHVLGYAGLVVYLWRVLLARGADRVIALSTCVVLLFLGMAAFLSSVVVGSLLVMALLPVIAARLDRDGRPTPAQGLVVAGALLILSSATSLGIASLVGCLAAVVVSRRLRWWWWTFLPAALVYGSWYLAYGGEHERSAIAWGRVLKLPANAVLLLGSAWRDLTGLPGPAVLWGIPVVAGLLLGVGWLLWRRRLRCWDGVYIFTLGTFLAMVLMVRAGDYVIDQLRYEYTLVLLAVPFIVPHLRLPGGWRTAVRIGVVAVVGACLLAYNGWLRVAEIDRIERTARQVRDGVEGVAAVLAAGEPAIDDLRLRTKLGIRGAAGLTVADVRNLVADGWAPAARPATVRKMQVALRISTTGAPPDEGSDRPLALAGVGEEGCLVLDQGGEVTAEVIGTGWLDFRRVEGEGRARLDLIWSDGFGDFKAKLVVGMLRPVQLAAPVGDSFFTIRNTSGWPVVVCGLEDPSSG